MTIKRRAAGMYAMTLLVSVLITGIGGTLVSMQMANRRLDRNLTDAIQADLMTRSALEWTLLTYQNTPDWRAKAVVGSTATRYPVALKGFVVSLTDATGDFTDDDTASVELVVKSTADGAIGALAATLEPQAHHALGHAIHTSSSVMLAQTAAVGGTLFAGESVDAGQGFDVVGDLVLETPDVSAVGGGVSFVRGDIGDATSPTPDMTFYVSRATPLTSPDSVFLLERALLTETYSTFGVVNPDGIYHIDAGGRDVLLSDVEVVGTLIITNTLGASVTIADGGRYVTGSLRYPTLLIDVASQGDVFITVGASFNEKSPPKADVDYNQDGDALDTITSEFTGILWTNANKLELTDGGVTHTGSIIAGWMSVGDGVTVVGDPTLSKTLVPGFTDNKLHLKSGSVRPLVLP
jgi:hypothetical protein